MLTLRLKLISSVCFYLIFLSAAVSLSGEFPLAFALPLFLIWAWFAPEMEVSKGLQAIGGAFVSFFLVAGNVFSWLFLTPVVGYLVGYRYLHKFDSKSMEDRAATQFKRFQKLFLFMVLALLFHGLLLWMSHLFPDQEPAYSFQTMSQYSGIETLLPHLNATRFLWSVGPFALVYLVVSIWQLGMQRHDKAVIKQNAYQFAHLGNILLIVGAALLAAVVLNFLFGWFFVIGALILTGAYRYFKKRGFQSKKILRMLGLAGSLLMILAVIYRFLPEPELTERESRIVEIIREREEGRFWIQVINPPEEGYDLTVTTGHNVLGMEQIYYSYVFPTGSVYPPHIVVAYCLKGNDPCLHQEHMIYFDEEDNVVVRITWTIATAQEMAPSNSRWLEILLKILGAGLVIYVLAKLRWRPVKLELDLDDGEDEVEEERILLGRRNKTQRPFHKNPVRKAYRQFLASLTKQGIEISPHMTTAEIHALLETKLDPHELEAVRSIYLKVRYGEAAYTKDDVKAIKNIGKKEIRT